MKKLLTTNYSAGAFNTAILLLRIVFGVLMMSHGYDKLTGFTETAKNMPSFLGMGSAITAALVVFAEFFCAMFIVLGLFTRLAAIPLVITMGYALFKAHNSEVFGDGEMATLFLAAYVTLLIIGPGKISVDGMIGK